MVDRDELKKQIEQEGSGQYKRELTAAEIELVSGGIGTTDSYSDWQPYTDGYQDFYTDNSPYLDRGQQPT